MTNAELNTAILSLKSQMLDCTKIYFDKMSIGSKITTDRQRDILEAVDIYLGILDYYYNISEAVREDESPITEDEVLEIIAEASKVLDTYQSAYYVS
jgi:hypothetical protein